MSMRSPALAGPGITVYLGDCLDVLAEMDDASIDAIVTDPPYDLTSGKKGGTGQASLNVNSPAGRSRISTGFMGKAWDGTGIAFRPEVWAECLRVLKPGGHLLAFGGSRTSHRLTCAVEDAGFEIRDSIAWLYGSGFPKSLDVSKAIDKADGYWRGKAGEVESGNGSMGGPNYARTPKGDPVTAAAAAAAGWGTALKPAFEPIVVGRKPLIGTVANNVMRYGTGALNIDGCRVRLADGRGREQQQQGQYNAGSGSTPIISGDNRDKIYEVDLGRWPPNVILDGSQADALDDQAGMNHTGGQPAMRSGIGYGSNGKGTTGARIDLGTGGVSRYFPTFRYQAKAPSSERPQVDGLAHPTVKPLALMRWLVRLVTPTGGVVLDPFAGSGATLEAARLEGFDSIGIEREVDYLALIAVRVNRSQVA